MMPKVTPLQRKALTMIIQLRAPPSGGSLLLIASPPLRSISSSMLPLNCFSGGASLPLLVIVPLNSLLLASMMKPFPPFNSRLCLTNPFEDLLAVSFNLFSPMMTCKRFLKIEKLSLKKWIDFRRNAIGRKLRHKRFLNRSDYILQSVKNIRNVELNT